MACRKMIVALVGTLFLFAGCTNRTTSSYSDSIPNEIQKLINNKYAESLHAVGTSRGPEESIAISKAIVQARAEIAREFKSQVEVLQKDYVEAIEDHSAGEYNEVIGVFSSLELIGSNVAKVMIRKEKDDLYFAKVLVVVSAGQFKDLIDQKLRDYTSFKATKAYKELQERVAREKENQ